MKAPAAVALFVRLPVPGRVKTRLAAAIGDRHACRLYMAMVADILVQIRNSGLPLWLFYDDGSADALPADWTGAAAEVRRQADGDIGERMAAAFAQCFTTGLSRVILVGSDLPGLDAQLLQAANSALDSDDAVFAPTVDGGYGLVGLRADRFHRQIFRDIPWSTCRTMTTTMQRCRQCDVTMHLLPILRDIDTLDALGKYAAQPAPQAVMTNRVISVLAESLKQAPDGGIADGAVQTPK